MKIHTAHCSDTIREKQNIFSSNRRIIKTLCDRNLVNKLYTETKTLNCHLVVQCHYLIHILEFQLNHLSWLQKKLIHINLFSSWFRSRSFRSMQKKDARQFQGSWDLWYKKGNSSLLFEAVVSSSCLSVPVWSQKR